MCLCSLSTRTSALIRDSFTLAYQEGLADAARGLEARPLTLRDAKRAVSAGCDCRCDTARQARRFIARAHRLGYRAGFGDLFGNEVAARGVGVVSIEEAKAARIARAAFAPRPAVND